MRALTCCNNSMGALQVVTRGPKCELEALNQRGRVLLAAARRRLESAAARPDSFVRSLKVRLPGPRHSLSHSLTRSWGPRHSPSHSLTRALSLSQAV